MKRQKIQGLSRTWWTPCGRSGEAQWALPAGFGWSPENPKVFHNFQHSGWPLLTLNVDHHAAIGGQDPLDPRAYAPVFSSGTEGIRSRVRSSTRERKGSQLRRRARNTVLGGTATLPIQACQGTAAATTTTTTTTSSMHRQIFSFPPSITRHCRTVCINVRRVSTGVIPVNGNENENIH